ncbi:unnamed protein product [Kuraishia capsulata CBS 1993]|uniref:Tyrosine specific protein phosphatases domain-containing protein n=1 Tax=Kuraishia capsulata CBS 1993 TaxID=1382522 RepID=W6MGK1_9ASCO|nr:uncharacterized protein KUCA_T00000913001 [Kuraishia capsulata CBS 1993]CDK24946.1 unnamed protein product [Kuraishia capsulata CBS 1993]
MDTRDINQELREEEALLSSVHPARGSLRVHTLANKDSEIIGDYTNVILTKSTLESLQRIEEAQTNTGLKRLGRVLRTVLRSINPFNKDQFALYSKFEKLVLNEPNDATIIAKYSTITKLRSGLPLCTLSIPHPLRMYSERNVEDFDTVKTFLEQLDTLPVLVLIHGLGGQMSQFEPLMGLFSQCADVVSLDLPGFGNSKFNTPNVNFFKLSSYDKDQELEMRKQFKKLKWDDFKTENIATIIQEFLDQFFPKRTFILVGHSMGTHISTKLLLKLKPETVEALVLLSPPSFVGSKPFVSPLQKFFLSIFNFFPVLFDFFRIADRIGGIESKSVLSYIYSGGENHSAFKKLRQMRWNLDTDSETFLKYIRGFQRCDGLELVRACKRIRVPPTDDALSTVLIMCGEDDKVTPFKASQATYEYLKDSGINPTLRKISHCNHSLLLDKPELVSGLVLDFVESLPYLHISVPWCLKVKATINGDKWGLKNELKWAKLQNVSEAIVNPTTGEESPLVSMKTLRESDPIHNPASFEAANPRVIGIIDIGSDYPSYNPEGFTRVKYHKLPTVSKYIPDSVQVRNFVELVESILEEYRETHSDSSPQPLVAVHCHYGFNRTGYLVCCYLVEKCGWDVADALEGFRKSREPGIKHPHFIDGLYLRYNND